ncbi:MAG: DotH/IcmK family type IV secretion protein [Legionellaceae bacterium]|jgi:intracellular multiplication protein IcmK|nr:DotH/IcmK family type IV secretion protein [Legionellaceae bacterium]
MKKKITYRLVWGVLIACLGLSDLAWCAEKKDSADQALQQLRLLQKRLGTSSSGEGASAEAGAPSSKPPVRQSRVTKSRASSENNVSSSMPSSNDAAIDDMAFREVRKQMFPLSPDQTIEVKKWYESDEYAKASSASTPPKPTATSQMVDLSPGSTPPVIRLSQGFVSSLVFLDSTGAPWPISAYDLGDPSAFNIQWDRVSNTLMIQASKLYNYGNLAVRLRGLNTPVMLTLIPGQKAVDYRVDLRVQGNGPNAKQAPMGVSLPSSASDVLLHVLDGVPPSGSSRLTVSGGDAQAWLLNGKMFVRTSLTILSPGWLGSMTSADGTHAYEMHKSPVLLVSWHGKVMQLKVEGL